MSSQANRDDLASLRSHISSLGDHIRSLKVTQKQSPDTFSEQDKTTLDSEIAKLKSLKAEEEKLRKVVEGNDGPTKDEEERGRKTGGVSAGSKGKGKAKEGGGKEASGFVLKVPKVGCGDEV